MKITVSRSALAVLGALMLLLAMIPGAGSVPALGAARSDSLRTFEARDLVLRNGLSLVLIKGPPGSGGAVLATFESGEASLPPSKRGTAILAARCLRGGSGEVVGEAFEQAVATMGARFVGDASRDIIEVGLEAPPESLAAATALVAGLISDPAYPEPVLAAEKDRLIAESAPPADVESRARSLLARILYDRHPYTQHPTPSSVGAVQVADLRAFHRRRMGAANVTVVIAGDLGDDDAVFRSARRVLEKLPAGEAVPPERFVPPPSMRRRVFLIHLPGRDEAAVALGNAAFRSGDPDEIPARLLERVLGADREGRVARRLVEEGHVATHAAVGFDVARQAGLFAASASGSAATIDSCASALLAELERARYEPPLPDELERAAAALSAERTAAVAHALALARETAEAVGNGLGPGWPARFEPTLERVSSLEVGRAGRRLVRPYTAPLVFAGDGTRLASRIRRFGEINWYDSEGEPMARSEIPSAESPGVGAGAPDGSAPEIVRGVPEPESLAAGAWADAESLEMNLEAEAGMGSAAIGDDGDAASDSAAAPAAPSDIEGTADSVAVSSSGGLGAAGDSAGDSAPRLLPLDPAALRGGEEATYQILAGDLEIATLTARVSEEEWDERPVFACHAGTEGGLHVEVAVAFSAEGMAPLSSRVTIQRDSLISETTLQYGSGRVWGRASTSRGDERTIEAETAEGTIDATMIPHVLRALPLERSREFMLATWSPREMAPVPVEVSIGGLEEVAVGTAMIVARRVEVAGSEAAGTYYVEEGAKRRIVKVALAGTGLTLLLK